jgi:Cd2+/Zn2+-exporting ATPase
MEEKIELEVANLLPGVDDDQDECICRLENSMQNQKGILRAHLKREKSPLDLCLHYDPDSMTSVEVEQLAEQTGEKILKRYHHANIKVADLDCSDCALVIAHSVGRMEGVSSASVDFTTQKLHVEYDKQKIDRFAIERRVRALGYTIPASGFLGWFERNLELLSSLFSGLLTLTGWVGGRFLGFSFDLSLALYLLAYAFGGWEVTGHVWHAIRERHFDTDVLMLAAAVGAAVLGDFAEGALLLFLFSLGHALEERALEHARSAVSALAELAPRTALVKRNGGEIEVAVEQLQIDDEVIIRPGARIPVDGTIVSGRSAIDQATVTGESIPVDKAGGDGVFAGTVNGQGALEVRVTRLAKDSTLARVMKMVEEAQNQKSPTQQTLEKFGRIYVPAILALTVLEIVVPPLFGIPFNESFLRAMTLLVAASPCALALGTPATILAGIAQAARNGILVKGGAHLENLGRLKAVAFEKTGTITYGKPEVTNVVSCDAAEPVEDLLALAALSNPAPAIRSRRRSWPRHRRKG